LLANKRTTHSVPQQHPERSNGRRILVAGYRNCLISFWKFPQMHNNHLNRWGQQPQKLLRKAQHPGSRKSLIILGRLLFLSATGGAGGPVDDCVSTQHPEKELSL